MKEHEHPYWNTPKKAHKNGFTEAIETDPREEPYEIYNKTDSHTKHPNYKHFVKGFKDGRKYQKNSEEGY